MKAQMSNNYQLRVRWLLVGPIFYILLSGCGGKDMSNVGSNQSQEVTAQSLGLGDDAKAAGSDKKGRLWFEVPGKPDRWVYDPKGKRLFKATKGTTGEWKFVGMPEVTAESLGLAPGVSDIGRDSNGRYWFDNPAKSERLVYDPKTMELHRATMTETGKWKIGEIVPVKQ